MKEVVLRSRSKASDTRNLVRSVKGLLRENLSDHDLLYELELVLMEACANVVMHAYPEKEGSLEVHVRIEQGRYIEFEIVNWGIKFDGPCERVVYPEPEAESGRGIYIIYNLMDECRYTEEDGRNVLILHKDIEEKLWTNCT